MLDAPRPRPLRRRRRGRGGIAGTPGAAGQADGGTSTVGATGGTAPIGRQDDLGGAAGTPEQPPNACLTPTAEDYEPVWMPPRAIPGACTTEQIAQKYDLCAGGSDQYNAAACRAFDLDPNNETCLACLFTAKGDIPSGPILVFPGDRWQANLGGCIALLDGDATATSCGARTQASDVCRYGICLEACGDSPTSEDWDACRAASRIACIPYVNDAACTSLPRYARCRYQSFQEYFLGIGDIFCGTGPDGTGTGGAGASVGGGGNAGINAGEGGAALL